MSSGSVTVSKGGARKKALDAQNVDAKAEATRKKRGLAFWGLDRNGYLSLSGAKAYVAKNHMAGATDPARRFVYYPDIRFAGTLSQLWNLLAPSQAYYVGGKANLQAGGNGFTGQRAQLTGVQQLLDASFDPLNPNDLVIIESLKPKAASTKDSIISTDEWLEIGAVLSKNKASKSGKKSKKGTTDAAVQSHLNQRIADFNALMDEVLAGREPASIINVTKYNPQTFTEARKSKPPTPGSTRSNAIQPVVTLGNASYKVPVMAQREQVANIRSFVDGVVRRSKYAQYADAILQSLDRQMSERQTLGGAGMAMPMPAMQMPMQAFAGPVSALQLPTASGMALPMNTSVAGFPQGFAAPAGSLSPRASNLASPPPLATGISLPPVSGIPMGRMPSPVSTLRPV